MHLEQEQNILDEGYRKKVITEIMHSQENISRKDQALRKHEIYRDMNKKWVMEALVREGFKQKTLFQMENRAANISICRKIINKLAQTYIGGVKRTVEDTSSQESIDALANELDVDSVMKKSDRFRQLFKNTMIQVVPIPSITEVDESDEYKWRLMMKVLAPWEYDVIEDYHDKTQARVVILTTFPERARFVQDQLLGSQGYRTGVILNFKGGDSIEQEIADSPEDEGGESKREFIWWSNNYHFTTNVNGKVIPKPGQSVDLLNPIGILPFVNVTGDQDGHFWANGGDDLIDGSILLNKMLTDLNFITFCQGWGQLVIAAKDIPKLIEGGPDNAFLFDVKEGDPNPQVFFATSNPPISQWLESIKSYLALLLSTNNLSPRNISGNLDANNAASGIALMIDQSEITQELQDVQKIYQDKEPVLWDIISKWHGLYHESGSLEESLQEIEPPADTEVTLKFHSIKPTISEKEKLETMKLRDELGISTTIDLLRIDNPDLSDADAEAKAKEIAEEKAKRQEEMMSTMIKQGEGNAEEAEEPTETEEEPAAKTEVV